LFRSLPPPPTPTLFPYNDALPIFRRRDELGDRQRPAGRQRDARIVAVEERGVHGRPLGGIVELCRRDGRQGERADARRRDAQLLDRKSTRLNSSHVSISYAVFCLK